jgi:predicted AAA+ superfamily ATPase
MAKLMLYRNIKYNDLFEGICRLAGGTYQEDWQDIAGSLVSMSEAHGFSGNIWNCFLSHVIANNENVFSCACEIRGYAEGSINDFARMDFVVFRQLFNYDMSYLDNLYHTGIFSLLTCYTTGKGAGQVFNPDVRDSIVRLSSELSEAADSEAFFDAVVRFYRDYGVGKYGLHKAFSVSDRDGHVVISPITKTADNRLSDLVGYEQQKQKLIENTDAFVSGRPANNCLLFGDAGTGKSTSIKALLNEYYSRGLRMIELYRHQLKDLPEVIRQIKNRNYRFIIYMDDLSFEDYETDYKYLKAVIEGGLERKPDNVLIYATSNRRHLIRENYSDKTRSNDELHTADTVQEKLSLAYRFGVTVYFGKPNKKSFQDIVRTLARRRGIHMSDEELMLEANKWELSHGGMTGRTAEQFITHLLGTGTDQE